MIKPIAIYLPQFHAIPENDKAWGPGFTEWRNVKKAQPLFNGHYQPHVPHPDIGYYNLNEPEILVKQAEMAKRYGIYGFAFYHYWFEGKRLLDRPVSNMLKLKVPDFPFCIIWANESWSKHWNGSNREVIQLQTYSSADHVNHIRYLCENVFCDERYIKVNGKPLFIIYRTELIPNLEDAVNCWRREAKRFGYKDLYLVRVEHFVSDIHPVLINFDAAMEFAPDFKYSVRSKSSDSGNNGLFLYDYRKTIEKMISKPLKDYTYYRCVFPAWDNTSRMNKDGLVFINSSLAHFEKMIENSFQYSIDKLSVENQFVFINAWNEWAEGCHIEPDEKFAYSYLNSIRTALGKYQQYKF